MACALRSEGRGSRLGRYYYHYGFRINVRLHDVRECYVMCIIDVFMYIYIYIYIYM